MQKSKNVIPEVLNRESSSFKINDPRLRPSRAGFWIPAFAGMTDFRHKNILLQEPQVIGIDLLTRILKQSGITRNEWIREEE